MRAFIRHVHWLTSDDGNPHYSLTAFTQHEWGCDILLMDIGCTWQSYNQSFTTVASSARICVVVQRHSSLYNVHHSLPDADRHEIRLVSCSHEPTKHPGVGSHSLHVSNRCHMDHADMGRNFPCCDAVYEKNTGNSWLNVYNSTVDIWYYHFCWLWLHHVSWLVYTCTVCL